MSAYDEEFSRAFDDFRPFVEGLSDAELDALRERAIVESAQRGETAQVVKKLRRQADRLEAPPPPREDQQGSWRNFKFGKKDRKPKPRKYQAREAEAEAWRLNVGAAEPKRRPGESD